MMSDATVSSIATTPFDAPAWIATPWIAPDHRGPVDRAYTPFSDPADARPMIDMLRAIVLLQPDAIAIESEDGALTYQHFFAAVAELHLRIEAAQPAPGRVGILLSSSASYAIAVFAALAARRPAVLLDASFPAARNALIAAQTGVNLVLSHPGVSPTCEGAPCLGVSSSALANGDSMLPLDTPLLGLDEPAFILCTSGSSGAPKPIVHSQRTMLNWLRATHDGMHVTSADRALSLSSFSSLGGITGMLSFLLGGASLQMLDLKTSGLGGLLETLRTRPVTILRAAPSMLRALTRLPGVRSAFSRLRIAQTYGEPLMKSDVAALSAELPPGCLIRTTYGSTEASGMTWYAGDPDDYDPVRVASGTLLRDTQAAIVSDDGSACPTGETGELLIRSRYNALGEWIDGQLMPGRLSPHPSGDGTRVYRTGDLARYHADGVFVVLGRKDRMIKINGQRLEPAEIETALRRVNGVLHGEVVVQPHPASPSLVAFVVPNESSDEGFIKRVRLELRAVLPEFMVPARIVCVQSIPLLPGGKIDTLSLLAALKESA